MSPSVLDAPESKLHDCVPTPAVISEMLFQNRKERCLLRQLLKVSERVYSINETNKERKQES